MQHPDFLPADEEFMRRAIQEASKAFEKDEVPVGAIIAIGNQVIGRGHNQVELLNDATAHAEIIAITAASQYLSSKYLPEATLYVTLEPCIMCAGALYWSKIGRVVYGASDAKNGYRSCCGDRNPFHPKTNISSGLLGDECSALMTDFFRKKR